MSPVVPIVERYSWNVRCQVNRRKDGDTFVVVAMVPGTIDIPMLDLHADMEFPQEYVVRLEGVNAFEKSKPGGKEAIAWVDNWFAQRAGQQLYLATNRQKDSFGRTLGDIRTSPDHLTGLANDLLHSGYAVPYTRERHGAW